MTREETLNRIIELEEDGNLPEAYKLYKELYENFPNDYEIWKHFYFLIWLGIEDMDPEFQEEISIRELLQKLYDEGKSRFTDIADFYFIAGYTVSIFPYEYGEYDTLEKEGNRMLKTAFEMEQDNMIYRMVYLGNNGIEGDSEYFQAAHDAAPMVKETFKNKGAMNKYFRQILYRPKD